MTTPAVASRFRRLAVLLCLPGCQVWTPIELAPTRTYGRSTEIRIARTDGRVVGFFGPRIVGDSVVGGSDQSPDRPAVALVDVRRAEVHRLSKSRTALAAVGVVGGVVLTVAAVAAMFVVGLGGIESSTP